jgi:hypothetical protein
MNLVARSYSAKGCYALAPGFAGAEWAGGGECSLNRGLRQQQFLSSLENRPPLPGELEEIEGVFLSGRDCRRNPKED